MDDVVGWGPSACPSSGHGDSFGFINLHQNRAATRDRHKAPARPPLLPLSLQDRGRTFQEIPRFGRQNSSGERTFEVISRYGCQSSLWHHQCRHLIINMVDHAVSSARRSSLRRTRRAWVLVIIAAGRCQQKHCEQQQTKTCHQPYFEAVLLRL